MYEEEIDGTGVVGRVVLTIGRNSIRSRLFRMEPELKYAMILKSRMKKKLREKIRRKRMIFRRDFPTIMKLRKKSSSLADWKKNRILRKKN